MASPTMLVNIAAGEVALGCVEEAAVFNKKTLTFNPNLQSAITLTIEARRLGPVMARGALSN